MTWTFTNLAIQIVAGMIGGNLIPALGKEHSFGVVGHTVVGAVAGALSGYFLQLAVGTVVMANGAISDSDPVDQAVLQGIAGLVAGVIGTLLVALLKHSIAQHKITKP